MPGRAGDQAVAADEQRDHDLLEHFVLADDHPADLGDDVVPHFLESCDAVLQLGGIDVRMVWLTCRIFILFLPVEFKQKLLSRFKAGRGFERGDHFVASLIVAVRGMQRAGELIVRARQVDGRTGHSSLEFANGASGISEVEIQIAEPLVGFVVFEINQIQPLQRRRGFFLPSLLDLQRESCFRRTDRARRRCCSALIPPSLLPCRLSRAKPRREIRTRFRPRRNPGYRSRMALPSLITSSHFLAFASSATTRICFFHSSKPSTVFLVCVSARPGIVCRIPRASS